MRITGGSATQGGGIAMQPARPALTIRQSLIDGNTATGPTATDAGGGIFIQGQTFGDDGHDRGLDDLPQHARATAAASASLNNTQQPIRSCAA